MKEIKPDERIIKSVKTKWSRAEKKAWRMPAKISVSEWADNNIILGQGSAEPGQWRTSRTPCLKGVMDAFSDDYVRVITLMFCTQVGKTSAMLNMLAYAVDQDPGPALWVHPDKDLVREFCEERIMPQLRLSPETAKHISTHKDAMTKKGIKLDRMRLYLGWAGSPAVLSSRAVKYVFNDEIDKYPKFSGREASPVKLSTERTKTYWNYKSVRASTPTSIEGSINKDFEKSDKRTFHIPCPYCGKYQQLIFSQVKWPKDERNPEKIIQNQLARYECVKCKKRFTNTEKLRQMQKGVWCPEGCEVNGKGELTGDLPAATHIGFHLSALYAPWMGVTLSHVAAEFLSSKDDPEDLMNFVNSWLAEPWAEKITETEEDEIKARAGEHLEGEVPDRAIILTAAVDVQKDHFWIAIRAWGLMGESWLVRVCRVESWMDVAAVVLETEYPCQHNPRKTFEVRMANIDSKYRTDEVYAFCKEHSERTRAIAGRESLRGIPYYRKQIERAPKTGKVIKGGVGLWHIDTTYYKDKLSRLISAEGNAQKWHLFFNPPDWYVSQMTAEHKVVERKGSAVKHVWRLKTQSRANHSWDLEVYNVAAADMMRLFYLRKGGKIKHQPSKPQATSFITADDNWISGTEGWI